MDTSHQAKVIFTNYLDQIDRYLKDIHADLLHEIDSMDINLDRVTTELSKTQLLNQKDRDQIDHLQHELTQKDQVIEELKLQLRQKETKMTEMISTHHKELEHFSVSFLSKENTENKKQIDAYIQQIKVLGNSASKSKISPESTPNLVSSSSGPIKIILTKKMIPPSIEKTIPNQELTQKPILGAESSMIPQKKIEKEPDVETQLLLPPSPPSLLPPPPPSPSPPPPTTTKPEIQDNKSSESDEPLPSKED